MNDETLPVVEIKARDQREMNMALARLGGATYRQIGEDFGLSRQRVYQILTRMQVDTLGPTFGKARGHPHVDGHTVEYFPPGVPIFTTPERPRRSFKGVIGKGQRREDVRVAKALQEKLGRLPYLAEIAEARYGDAKRMSPVLNSHWVTHRGRPGKASYSKYRDRLFIAAFGWGTKAPDGRKYLAALAQQSKEQAKWLTA